MQLHKNLCIFACMKIANIVSTINITVSDDFNVVMALDDIIQGLPTLIIGWDYIKKNFPDYDIIDRKLGNNIFWTFKPTEKRDLYQQDLYNFINRAYKNLLDKVKYYFIDPFVLTRKQVRKTVQKILTSNDKISYLHDKMIYIYFDNMIIGINLEMLEFMGLNTDKIVSKIKSSDGIFLDKDSIFIEYKDKVEMLDGKVRFLPLLYSIKHG